MVEIYCPNCGAKVSVKVNGRKPLNIPLNKLCESLQIQKNPQLAAENLGCSQGYIYNELKRHGLKVSEVIKRGTYGTL